MKVLIVSHNPITTFNSMGKTLLSLFHSFHKDELCQFYIYPTIPDVHKCEDYFRVTDKEVIRSLIPLNGAAGRQICSEEISGEQCLYESPSEQALFRDKRNCKELKLITRHLCWSVGKWHSKALRVWIDHNKPDLIFACGGLSSFFYDVILELSHRYELPIVTYVCDDFYFSTQKWESGLLQKFYYKLLRKKISQLITESCGVVTICDAMSEDYRKIFGCKTLTISTGSAPPEVRDNTNFHDSNPGKNIRYFGNLQLNRWESLLQIGLALEKVNKACCANHILEIYTADRVPEELASVSTIRVMGFVDSNTLDKLVQSAELLIHTESFREEDVDRVRYSVSTKIAESLWSGVPLFAYGCADIASIAHLRQSDCAFICDDTESLAERLTTAIYDNDERKRVVENALNTANKYHDRENNSKLLYTVLQSVKEERIEK